VLVYPRGARFVPHKDTPRYEDQLGTLIVELPSTHRGGDLTLLDGDRRTWLDWAGEADSTGLRWVALFGDVDHEIARIVDGVRVTAVYTLRYRGDARMASADRERVDALIDAAIALHDDEFADNRLAIPCGRMIVTPRDATFPITRAALRGADRVIAAALERAGFAVTVHECIALVYSEETQLREAIDEARRNAQFVVVTRAIPGEIIDGAQAIAWHPDPQTSYDYVIAAVASYVDPQHDLARYRYDWLVRAPAKARGRDMLFSHSGYFGNEYSTYWMYRFGVLTADPARSIIPDACPL
jgi:hypothetical protein